jgi:hypothetical protein
VKTGSARLATRRLGANMGAGAPPVKSPDIERADLGRKILPQWLNNTSSSCGRRGRISASTGWDGSGFFEHDRSRKQKASGRQGSAGDDTGGEGGPDDALVLIATVVPQIRSPRPSARDGAAGSRRAIAVTGQEKAVVRERRVHGVALQRLSSLRPSERREPMPCRADNYRAGVGRDDTEFVAPLVGHTSAFSRHSVSKLRISFRPLIR